MPIYAFFPSQRKRLYTVVCEGAGLTLGDFCYSLSVLTGLHRYYRARPGDRVGGKRVEPVDLVVTTVLATPNFVPNHSTVEVHRVPRHRQPSIVHTVVH